MPKSFSQSEHGFTILETMIASMIMLVGALAIGGLFLMAVQGDSFGSNTGIGTMAVQDKIEQLKALDFDTASELAPGGSLDESLPDYSSTDASGDFVVRWQVFDATAPAPNTAPSPRMKVLSLRAVPINSDSRINKVVEARTIIIGK